ncbi:MAG: FAD-dependent oxidoreductase [Xenococcaceae cyanobacterium MO_167.B52]|nr:FAD-dependent oxidoreductase [Xenococcaceae cyanobacterium MO_167.B52]
METITTDVLVVGGSVGGVAAAIQASRRGVKTILATEFKWLGGMLTSAGVCAPDGNELRSWHTGLWGAYLRELQARQIVGLDNGWVSLFTYHPHCGAAIFADWVKQLPNLLWLQGYQPFSVIKNEDHVTEVVFSQHGERSSWSKNIPYSQNLQIKAKITIDATELGDLLALAEASYRWGWETSTEFDEPSLVIADRDYPKLKETYPIQAPTWVFLLQDNLGESSCLPIPASLHKLFKGAWEKHGAEKFLSYGKLTDNLYMINWPIAGNDYGVGLERIIASESSRKEFLTEAYNHSYSFAAYIQSELGKSCSLAEDIFPHQDSSLNSAFAFHPYYRESRRVIGKTTITEKDILPRANGCAATLPVNEEGVVNAIAVGNYPNDHHYPGINFPLQPKSIKWGGRWTGTPFTIPYDAIIPESLDGLVVAEKSISVSHIANGSTRLQPVVMNIGQAAGMAAALCVEFNCQPRELDIRTLQQALLTDLIAPSAVIPLFNLSPNHPQWLDWQQYYLDHPEHYPLDGNFPGDDIEDITDAHNQIYQGKFCCYGEQSYQIILKNSIFNKKTYGLITLHSTVNKQLLDYPHSKSISVLGRVSKTGYWLIVEKIIID